MLLKAFTVVGRVPSYTIMEQLNVLKNTSIRIILLRWGSAYTDSAARRTASRRKAYSGRTCSCVSCSRPWETGQTHCKTALLFSAQYLNVTFPLFLLSGDRRHMSEIKCRRLIWNTLRPDMIAMTLNDLLNDTKALKISFAV